MSSSAVKRTDQLVILIVEDEMMLRKVVAATLRRGNFEVVEAADGAAALEILESNPRIDALLSDIRMPGMNGYELANHALCIRPTMPVVLMTGYTNEEMPETIRQAEVPVLAKPFDFARLADTIRELIAAD